ncbi:WXG100 family type VII secretion target [Micrococcales bacterium 31B]|nr:WXG100 family type VII secretion target [Micrococcales bacterium 31B]
MSTFAVNAERVNASAAKCAVTSQEVRASVTSLMADLNDLRNSWSGGAAEAFNGLMAQWKTTQDQVFTNLDAIDQALKNASAAYAEVEMLNTRMFAPS